MPTLEDAQFMRSLLAASDDCIKVIDLDGTLAFMSEGGQRTMEVSDFNAIRGCPWPDFWEGQGNRDALAALQEARSGRSARFFGSANTAAGNPRYWDVQVSPIRNEDGTVRAILSVSRDITALKAAEDNQRLLALEINHRLKNVIAMIQAIANQTLKGSAETEQAKARFVERLGILSTAQDALTGSTDLSADLSTLISDTLRVHCEPWKYTLTGPDVRISSQIAFAMALGLHELATNALKYGGLANDDGRITINWDVQGGEFRFQWKESGGPPVEEPAGRGFGSRMIERALPGYLRGEARIDYARDGVIFTVRSPAAALEQT